RMQGFIASMSEKIGAPLSVTSVDFDLAQWFRFQPAVALKGVTIGNPPGFPAKPPLLDANEISAQVALVPLFQKRIEVRSITVEKPRILVVSNSQGTTNVETLIRKTSAAAKSGPGASDSGAGAEKAAAPAKLSISQISITDGSLRVGGGQPIEVQAIDIRLHDFSTDRPCRLEASVKLFGNRRSGLKIDSFAGPFTSDSLPLDGALSLVLAPGEIPAAMRRERFGSLLGAPGEKGVITLEATIKGDAYRTLSGPAKVTLADIFIGKDAQHLLPLSGEVPAQVSIGELMSNPAIQITIDDAKLRLSKGEWSGKASIELSGSATKGRSQGSIHNVDINELLSSFTESGDKLQGTAEISSYSLQFTGKDAGAIRNSLRGSGKVALSQGRVSALDLLASLEKALSRSQQEADASKGATQFTTLNAGVNIGDARIQVNGLALDAPTLQARGNGVIGFDHSLSFDLTTEVGGNVARIANQLLRSQSDRVTLPVKISGTTDAPKVRPVVSKVAKERVKGFVKKLLRR
ncbi:MAG: AsmA family protein, partial [Bryobacteraceae bacterium]